MTTKLNTLTIFLTILTLTIGLPSINSLSNIDKANALDEKTTEAIKKVCPSYENSNSYNDEISNIIKSCSTFSQIPPLQSPILGSAIVSLQILMHGPSPSDCGARGGIGVIIDTETGGNVAVPYVPGIGHTVFVVGDRYIDFRNVMTSCEMGLRVMTPEGLPLFCSPLPEKVIRCELPSKPTPSRLNVFISFHSTSS